MTATGTNLLGLVKHMATWDARYLGEVFNRPFPEPLPRWQDSDGSELWVTEGESREQITAFYRRAWKHADATIHDVKLFSIMVHVLNDTTRHAGHADILREHLDGQTGVAAGQQEQIDTIAREAHCARIEKAARAASPTRT